MFYSAALGKNKMPFGKISQKIFKSPFKVVKKPPLKKIIISAVSPNSLF